MPYSLSPGKLEKQLKPRSVQVSKPIWKVVEIDCGFSLTENFQCITFIVKDITIHYFLASFLKHHNIILQSNLTSLSINCIAGKLLSMKNFWEVKVSFIYALQR